ncbi:MAG: hypothetical protein WC081_02350 [Candidatus Ratteibacteria bacterium]|jgi:ABC-type transport system involved in multi-copper enzyme maturation permease subunit
MKSLFWKEWRENRTNLLIGIMIVIGFLLLSFFVSGDMVDIAKVLALVAIFAFAGVFGAWSFTKEKNTLEFFLSTPVKRETIFLNKWLSGILNILILLSVVLVMEAVIFYSTGGFNFLFHLRQTADNRILAWSLPAYFLYYNIAFLLSLLLFEIISAVLGGLIIYVVVAIPFVSFFSSHGPRLYHALAWIWTILQLIISLSIFLIAYRIFSRKEVKV